jgi:hypothetical protein
MPFSSNLLPFLPNALEVSVYLVFEAESVVCSYLAGQCDLFDL